MYRGGNGIVNGVGRKGFVAKVFQRPTPNWQKGYWIFLSNRTLYKGGALTIFLELEWGGAQS